MAKLIPSDSAEVSRRHAVGARTADAKGELSLTARVSIFVGLSLAAWGAILLAVHLLG